MLTARHVQIKRQGKYMLYRRYNREMIRRKDNSSNEKIELDVVIRLLYSKGKQRI